MIIFFSYICDGQEIFKNLMNWDGMTPISSESLSHAAAFLYRVYWCTWLHMRLKIMPLFSDFIVRHDLVTKDIFQCLIIHSLNSPPSFGCRSREEKGSHDLCRRCRVPPGLPHPGCHWRPRGPTVPWQQQWGLHVVLAGPPAQLCGRQEPGGPEQHPQGWHRASARCHHGPPEKQILQQPQQHVTGLPRCGPTGTFTLSSLMWTNQKETMSGRLFPFVTWVIITAAVVVLAL